MAFGFGFNKQKILSAAEKFVQQGKLQNAIAEYDKILKSDEDDLTINNTIGDLYSRLGDSSKAIECFKKVGDAYAAQGFTVKGIAMYKKIAKLQPSVDGSLKLAELYTQQGLFNDARAQYLQVAEDFMKNGDLEQAVRLFRKVLEMDPENAPMRVKLGEVYVRLGKKKEAWELFSAAAESLRSRGALPAAEDVLKRLLSLDPTNSYVLLLRGKTALENDDPKSAIECLEKAADIDSQPEGLRDLLKAYLQIGNMTKAAPIAEKLLSVHTEPEGLFLLVEGCSRLGEYHQALEVCTRYADRLLATDSTKMLSSLHAMISHVRDDSEALEALLVLLNKAGETTHINEVNELLAHASVNEGNLARARDLYQMLAAAEPQNQVHMQHYQQVVERMAGPPPTLGITSEEGAVIVEELEATAPVIEQIYPDDIAAAVRSAVTDADLFLSYNLPEKAVVPLLYALPQAPLDARLNQRLAALHTRFQRFTEAAVCCRTLETVYRDAGHPDEAARYGDLAERYEQSAGVAPGRAESSAIDEPRYSASTYAAERAAQPEEQIEDDASPADWRMVEPNAPESEVEAVEHPEFSVHEVPAHEPSEANDLSSEWENSFSIDEPATPEEAPAIIEAAAAAEDDAVAEPEVAADTGADAIEGVDIDADADAVADVAAMADVQADAEIDVSSNPEIAETVEEIQFYIEHFMMEQARAGIEKLETLTRDARILDPLRIAIETSSQPPVEPEEEIAETEITEINADEPEDFEIAMEPQDASEFAATPDLMAGFDHATPYAAPAKAAHEPIHTEPAYQQPAYEEPAYAETEHAQANDLSALVADLEAALGDSFPQAEPPATKPSLTQPTQSKPHATHKPPVKQALPPSSKAYKSKFPPLAHVETPAAPAARPTTTASAGSAATAAAPAQTSTTMSYSPAPVRPLGAGAQAMHATGSVDLSEMFGELKHELEEEIIAGDDDPETHYNLGVAFREMGLLDEAIAELQKVCTSIERGKPFSQPVQTYTWLAQCFLDKGVPDAAIRWYEKALNIAGLDEESRLAINYELGSACESAMDKTAALRYFTDVYGSNIDYRDVAERIEALKS
jgi:tetratricopeptide (TPR) repeat protein